MQGDDGIRRPRIGVTLGDVNGVGPEVAVRAMLNERVQAACQPVAIGSPVVLEEALTSLKIEGDVQCFEPNQAIAESSALACWSLPDMQTPEVRPGEITAAAGRFAHDCLRFAARAAKTGSLDAICTAPLNKAALAAADIGFPGHTEILADEFGIDDFAMMLHLSAAALEGIRNLIGNPLSMQHGVAIAHVTLHTSVRSVPDALTADSILDKTRLVNEFLKQLGIERPAIGVCALNPHGGEGGLFGSEEATVIGPAVMAAQGEGIDAHGPFPTDTLIRRAILGEFQGVVAMYHDQGHIPIKLIGFDRAINITLGIPIVRTSPTHGTAFDIAWQGRANAEGMIEAMLLAAQMSQQSV